MATQRAWVFRLSNWEGDHVVQKRASNPSSLCLTRPQIHQGCQGSWLWKQGCGKRLNPAFKGDWGGGWDPRHPSPGAQLLGCWFCFSLKSGLRQPAGVSRNRIAYILELKIYGGSNGPVCTADVAGGGPHAHTHRGLCPRTAHTRVCAHTVYINIYIAQVYMLFTVYIYINIKHRYLYVCTIDTP